MTVGQLATKMQSGWVVAMTTVRTFCDSYLSVTVGSLFSQTDVNNGNITASRCSVLNRKYSHIVVFGMQSKQRWQTYIHFVLNYKYRYLVGLTQLVCSLGLQREQQLWAERFYVGLTGLQL